MKNLIIITLILISTEAFVQHSCCSLAALDNFSAHVSDPAFVSAHKSPLPFLLEDQKGEMIKIKTAEGADANAYEIKATERSDIISWSSTSGGIK